MPETLEKNYNIDIHGRHFSRMLMLILILIGTFGSTLMQTSLGTAIPTLMKDFSISMSTAQQATTWFLLANGIMVPISAYMANKFPTRWLYIAAYVILLLGMFLTYTAPTSQWWVFLVGRMFQAIAAGITMPLMQVCLVNMFSPKQMGAVMGLGGIVVGLAPAIGPTFAGWLMSKRHVFLGVVLPGSWRTMFMIPMVIVAVVTVLAIFLMHDVIPNRPVKLDLLSLWFSCIGFGLFLLGFTNVAGSGWTDFDTVVFPIVAGVIIIIAFINRQLDKENRYLSLLFLILGLVSLVISVVNITKAGFSDFYMTVVPELAGLSLILAFIVRKLHLKEPFLNIRVFMNKQFSLMTVVMALSTMAMMGVEMMLPLYLQGVKGLTAFNSGLVLLPGALLMGLISPLAGAAYDKVGAKRLALLGFGILALGTLPFLAFNASTSDHFITTLYALRMFGVAMVMMPLTASAMNVLPVEEIADGTASNATARSIASAVVVALLSSVAQNIITTNSPTKALAKTDIISFSDKMIKAMLNGYHASFAIGLAFVIVGLIISLFLKGGKVWRAEIDLQQMEEL
ncbi:MAG: MFS transporter [Streptococcaceae bacterium]|jgi:MFS family permease|nr:MFS transporter [Streptococcaceae bacterium]